MLFAAGLIVHAFLFNFYLRELQLPPTVMGHQVAAMTLGGLCALLPAGATIDRMGTRASLLAGVAATVVGLVLTALAGSAWLIYAAAFVTGMGAAACRVAWGPAIMRLTTERTRARAFTWNVALLIGSGAAWTYVAGVVRDRPPGFMRAGAAMLSATQWTLLAGAVVTALSIACYAGLRIDRVPASSAPARRRDLALPAIGGLRILMPLIAVWMVAAALVLPFFNIYFADRFALSVASVGAVFAGSQLGTALLLVIAAELARRYGPRRMLFIWMSAMAPALFVLAAGESLRLVVMAYLVQGVIGPATNPLLDQLLLERAPRERHGIVAGWRNAAAEGAGVAGAAAGGSLLSAMSFTVLFQSAAIVAAASAAALYWVFRATEAPRPLDVAVETSRG